MMNNQNYNRDKKHLLLHPQQRLVIILAIALIAGFMPYFARSFRTEASVNATVEFLKEGGYKEEYYTTGYYVEYASDTEKIVVEYMLEDVVSVYADGMFHSPQAAVSLSALKQYGVNIVTMPPDKIYEKLTQHGYNSYKVYQ